VRGVGDELPDLQLAAVPGVQRGLDVVEHGVQRRADLADLGPLVGEVRGHPLGEVDVALGQRQRGDRVRGGRHLGERPELATDEEQAAAGGQQRADHDQQRLPADERGDGLLDLVGGQPGHLGHVLAVDRPVHRDDPVAAELGQVDLVHVLVGRYVVQHGQHVVVERLLALPAREQGPGLLTGVAEERPHRVGGAADLDADRAAVGRRPARPLGVVARPDPRGGAQVVVELVGELGVERRGGRGADQHRDEHHQGDDGQDQPGGERGEGAAHQVAGLRT
jgi:hypothetical protein